MSRHDAVGSTDGFAESTQGGFGEFVTAACLEEIRGAASIIEV
jgi:hypothetical protein